MSRERQSRRADPDALAAYIARTVAAAPPLSREQADRLALLLRPGDRRAAA